MPEESSADITWPLVHKLAKPATVLGDEVKEIVLRDPTVADFLKFGVLDGTLDGERMVEMIAHLWGESPAKVKALPGVEVLKLSARLWRFFSQAAQ